MPSLLSRALGRREGAVATYAAVLDGVHLWLDVEGPVSVREGRTVTSLGAPPCDLSGLRGSSYDVLAGGSPVALEVVPGSPLTRTPLSPDGRTQWEVVAGSPLRLVRRDVAATAELDATDLRDDRIHLRLRYDVTPGQHLLLLDTDDRVLATLPVTAHEGLLEALVGADDLPAGYFGVLRVAVGTDDAWVRVRRGTNDLADPNRAVLLPELPEARLRWNPDGLLALRVLDPDEAS